MASPEGELHYKNAGDYEVEGLRGARAKWGLGIAECLGKCIRCDCFRCGPCSKGKKCKCGGMASMSGKAEVSHKSPKWRHELGECLESPWVWRPITTLLLIDVCFIFVEFIIHDYHFIDEDWPHDVGHYMKITSLVILTIFQIESLLTFIAFGSRFFRHVGFVLDGVVIPVSILMETVVSADAASLLVVLRFWRLVRIAHGIFEAQMVQMNQLKQELMKHKIVIQTRAPHLHKHIRDFDKKGGGLNEDEKLGISTMRMSGGPLNDSRNFTNRHTPSSRSAAIPSDVIDAAERFDPRNQEDYGRPEKGQESPRKRRPTKKSERLGAIPSAPTKSTRRSSVEIGHTATVGSNPGFSE